ncbi:Uncharacterised protein [Chlamydia trachomatis]|nr:Uncharacterised protein [Chlamydia trachomatis]
MPIGTIDILAPGDSFIFEIYIAEFFIKLEDSNSLNNSIASRDLSPEPIKMFDVLVDFLLTLKIISFIKTVLPTPAPPKIPSL